MTTSADGTTTCDRCGQPVSSTGLAAAVMLIIVGDDGRARTLHLGLADGCAALTLLPDGLAARMAADPFELYDPPLDDLHPDMTRHVVRSTE